MMPFVDIHKRVRAKETVIPFLGFFLSIFERHIPGNDDAVYEKNPLVWEDVPRGQANIYIKSSPDALPSDSTIVCMLRGVRKFGYSDSSYGRRSDVVSVIGIDKENGECAHVAAFEHAGTKFWVVGSKHVNVVFRDGFAREDLKKFEEFPRHRIALKIAKLFLATLEKMPSEQKQTFFDGLVFNHWTANAEAIFADSQHIVDYNGSNELRWFALSKDGPSSDGLCENPLLTAAFFESCNLHSVTHSENLKYKSIEYDAFLDSVARRLASEGVVMYGMDATGKVVCMWKEKSYSYVMERVVREAIKKGMVGDELFRYVQTRLTQQESRLRQYFVSWEETRLPCLIEFAAWLQTNKTINFKDHESLWSLSSKWLTLQREFMQLSQEQRTAIAIQYKDKKLSGVSAIQAVVLVGPPGSGKSTLSRTLVSLLKRCGKIPVWLNQDEAGGNRKTYIDAIKRVISLKDTTHVILDKSNMELANRKDYTSLEISPSLTVIFQHPDGDDALCEMCVDRIISRGDAHRSLRSSNPDFGKNPTEARGAITKIIQSFIERSDIQEHLDSSCVLVDATSHPNEILRTVWTALAMSDPNASLPKFEDLMHFVDESVANSVKYERLLSENNLATQKQLYACIKLSSPKEELLALVPPAATLGKIVKNEFHITVKYFGGIIDPDFFVKFTSLIGTKIALHATEVVFDDKGVAILIEPTFECTNAFPHFTIANAKGTPPVYSNELLGKTVAVTRIPIDVMLEGLFAFS
jgi:hypothetical protein